jgi:undecaprenyl diphosphate synthase
LPRIPLHVGIIPDGNRRWAETRGLERSEGYLPGVEPGLRLLQLCRDLKIEEASVYGFTKENARRPAAQVDAFRAACVQFARRAVDPGAALHVIGDVQSNVFPDALHEYTERRSPGDIRVNLLVNYGWQWDLDTALQRARRDGASARSEIRRSLGSALASRIDLVVRWGGRSRLSGFLPVQCAYADLFIVDTLWPDMDPEEFLAALRWYAEQDVTLGG